ncbi:MAG: TatD family deoxyribonuclease [Opitutus sp.]|nr:TatD family deoxyribonuclease [Opitutus sp.]
MFYDAHNHLHDASLAPHRGKIFADLVSASVKRAVVNGSCETDWPEVAALAKQHPIVTPSFGLHPWDAGNRTPDWQKNLLAHLDSDPRATVGEIGLDRWILDRARPDDARLAGLRRAPLAEQMEVFMWQLALAAARDLPASIHCLAAFGPLLDALRATPLPARGFLLHAYSGPTEMVKDFANLGAYFSFNGGYLAPRHARLRGLYAALPADRLLVETDAPAMRLPAPLEKFSLPAGDDRSFLNHPGNLAATYAALADLRGRTLDSLTRQVEENFLRLFGNPGGR